MSRLLVLLLLLNSYSFASERDSLLSMVDKGTTTEQVMTFLRLERQYRNSQPDSAMYYVNKAYFLATENHLDSVLKSVYNNLAITYKNKGNYDTTLYFFQQSFKVAKAFNDTLGMSTAYNNLGIYYDDIGEQSMALDNFIKSVIFAEVVNDSAGLALSYNNIGLIHFKNEDFKKAKTYYNKSLEIKRALKDSSGAALLYNNIGILYYYEDAPQKCIDYFKKAAQIWQKTNNKRSSAMVLSNIGELYYEIGIYQSAMNYLKESVSIYNELGDVSGELYSLNILGQVYQEWGNQEKAVEAYLNALEKAVEIDAKTEMYQINYNLFKLYLNNKDYEKSLFYLQETTVVKDSIMSVEKEKIMQEINTKYETEKKEQKIELLNNKNKLNRAEIARQKVVNISLIIGVLLVLIVVGLFIRQNRIRKKANLMLMAKNSEIQMQHAEISEQKDEIEAQRDLVHLQKEKIETIHEHVSQSIDYAERIQNSTLPRKAVLDKNFSDSFVYFLPRDIVSGDFYWWAHIEDNTVITAADSTGHGVPGAFMSMLGMSFLKEIVVKEYVTHPGVILRKMRKEIVNTLKQKGEIGEQKDGMDMALVSINHKTNMLQYAGANNPLYIIKHKNRTLENASVKLFIDEETPDYCLFEIKPDKMPVSIYDRMDRFKTHEIQLEKGDQLYMFSDGYADQFGGPKGKKLKYKPFKSLLLKNANLPMNKQKQLLSDYFVNWKIKEDQVDDVVIIGIKI